MEPNFLMKAVGNRAPAKGLPVKHPMMHRTRSVDYAVISSGEIDTMLDDSLMHLKSGDVVVQQATNHAWINRLPPSLPEQPPETYCRSPRPNRKL
jgi:hypothetical protein